VLARPIGSAVLARRDTDNVNVTERLDEQTLGHGEYWRNARLRAGINRFFDTAEVKQRKYADAVRKCGGARCQVDHLGGAGHPGTAR
jgi:hypothetical protein